MVKKILLICICACIILGVAQTTLKRTASFGCFDDCFNYTAGYLITQGKTLYTTTFYNHAPLPAYISAAVLTLTKPINIYDLLLQHRRFLVVFSLVWMVILIVRFGSRSALALIGYESIKWYFFGNRFLAEAFIVYPLAYLFLLCLDNKKKISLFESIWVGILTWFVVFSREPYIPLVLFLTVSICWKYKHLGAIVSTICLSLCTLPFFSIRELFFNIFQVNAATVLADSNRQTPFVQRIVEGVLYPGYLLLYQSERVWQSLQIVGIIVGTGLWYKLIHKKTLLFLVWIIAVLALSNIRATPIGTVYYSAFQLLPWVMIFFCTASYFITDFWQKSKKTTGFLTVLFFFAVGWTIFARTSYIHEKASPQEELIINFSEEIQIGNIIHHLSTANTTIFIDGWAELIYWQAQRTTNYRFGWYTSVMPYIQRYKTERLQYLSTTPPDIYYGSCPQTTIKERLLPQEIRTHYINITIADKPSCLWIKKDFLDSINDTQWKKAQEFLAARPNLVQ